MSEWEFHPIECTCPQDVLDKRGKCNGWWSSETKNLRIHLSYRLEKYTLECVQLGIRYQFESDSDDEAKDKAIQYLNHRISQYQQELVDGFCDRHDIV